MPSHDTMYTMKTLQAQITATNTDYTFPITTPSAQIMDIFRASYANPTSAPALIQVIGLPSGTPIDEKVVPANSSWDTVSDNQPLGTLPSGDSPTLESNVSGTFVTLSYIVREGAI